MIYIYCIGKGRLGNAMFRYLFSVILIIKYNMIPIYTLENINTINIWEINDNNYDIIKNMILNNIQLNDNTIYKLDGYFQEEYLITLYKKEIYNYLLTNLNDKLCIEHNCLNTYVNSSIILNSNLITPILETVVHIRLGDMLYGGVAIDPICYKTILLNLPTPIHFILDTPVSNDEKKYVQYLNDNFICKIHSNSIELDYHIMKNAKYLICSFSTISWLAAFWNTNHTLIYMPNVSLTKHGSTKFQYPTQKDKTVIYNFNYLEKIFSLS